MSREPIHVCFIGFMTSEDDRKRYRRYSQAAELFQDRFLTAIADAGVTVDRVYSSPPETPFPEGRLFIRGHRSLSAGGWEIRQLPFVNLGVIKVATLLIAILPRIALWSLSRYRRRRVVICYNYFPIPPLAVQIVMRLTGGRTVEVVTDFHIPGVAHWPGNVVRRLQFVLERATLRLLDGIIVLSRAIVDDLAPGTTSLVMEGAVPAQTVDSPIAASRTDRYVVLYAGELSRMLGVSLLLEAISLIEDRDVDLWLAGKGELTAEVERAAAQDPRIRYLGFLPHDELQRRYAEADVLVNPSSSRFPTTRYAFPSKLIEYLAAGRPVITTRAPGLRELGYEPYVHVLEDEHAWSLAELIIRVRALPHDLREQRAAAGRQFVLREKNWSRQGSRIVDFLRRITGEMGKI